MNILARVRTNVNRVTVNVYNKYFRDYIRNTPQAYSEIHQSMLTWIDSMLGQLPSNAKIFEIGSATPRDARYMRRKGFYVQCSDACENFVEYLRSHNENAIQFNALTDEIPVGYDMVFANAVFPHFTPQDLKHFLAKAHSSIKPGCLIAFDLKQGSGHTWLIEKMPVGRYTNYWQPQQVLSLVESCGYELVFFETNIPGGVPQEYWINIGLRKP